MEGREESGAHSLEISVSAKLFPKGMSKAWLRPQSCSNESLGFVTLVCFLFRSAVPSSHPFPGCASRQRARKYVGIIVRLQKGGLPGPLARVSAVASGIVTWPNQANENFCWNYLKSSPPFLWFAKLRQ